MEYQGKVVVVTGAGSGLGASMADLFANAGAKLALFDIDGMRAEAKAVELRAKGVDAFSMPVDVANRQSLGAAASALKTRFGWCDVLCANVGVQQFGAIEKLTAQDWAWVFQVNVMGMIDTVQEFLPLLRLAHGTRHIVLTSSSSYFTPGVRMAAYVTTKYAVVGYGEVLRQELAVEGINVSLLFPGGMMTRHLESSVQARPKELGESRVDGGDIEAMMASAQIDPEKDVATADDAIRNLLAELRDQQPYIITHGAYVAQIENRHQKVLAAFDRMNSSTRGLP